MGNHEECCNIVAKEYFDISVKSAAQLPCVIRFIFENINVDSTTEHQKQTYLETLGCICKDINTNINQSQLDQILFAIVSGMKTEDLNNLVKKAAANSLLSLLKFRSVNFSNDKLVTYLMQVVCDCTQCNDVEVSVMAFKCLIWIMSQYYSYIIQTPYLFNIGENHIYFTAVGVVGTISSEKGGHLGSYIGRVFKVLNNVLWNHSTSLSLRSRIISTYGSLVMHLGQIFVQYWPDVVRTLCEALKAGVDPTNAIQMGCLDSLRVSSINTFVALITAAKSNDTNENVQIQTIIIPNVKFFVEFVEHIGQQSVTVTSDQLLGACCCLIENIATVLGVDSLEILDTASIKGVVDTAYQSKNVITKNYALWAAFEIKELIQGGPVASQVDINRV